MSDFIKIIEAQIADSKDFAKVLQDIGRAFKNQGFFDDINWKEKLIEPFNGLADKVEKSGHVTLDSHDISNSFVENSLKSNKNNMFEDSSNDSFEIPETQAFPPIDHLNDELDSEGYVAMPDEGIEANNCSQSQALLDGVDLQRKSSTRQNFDDSDGDVDIDMEMSNLQWDESTKENGNNKSASVTPDLDFNALSKTVARVIEDTLWSPQQSKTENESSKIPENRSVESPTCQTPSNVKCAEDIKQQIEKIAPTREVQSHDKEHEFEGKLFEKPEMSATASDQFDDDMAETQLLAEPVESAADKGTTDNEQADADQLLKKLPESVNVETKTSVHCVVDMAETQVFSKSVARDQEKENFDPTAGECHDHENGENDHADLDMLFKKPGLSSTRISAHCNVDMAATQLFTKTVESTEDGQEIENADPTEKVNFPFKKPEIPNQEATKNSVQCDVEMVKTQIFTKPGPSASGTSESNRGQTTDDKADDVIDDLDETQVFPKSIGRTVPKRNCISSSEDEKEDDGKTKDVNVSTGDDAVTVKSKLPKKRNRLIDSSDDEESVVDDSPLDKGSADTSNDDAYTVATQMFEVRKPESPKGKRLFDFKEARWSQWCEEENRKQSNVVFKSIFDQCKDLKKELTDSVPVTSTVKTKTKVAAVAPKRQSSRSKSKTTEDSDAETKVISQTSKRQRAAPLNVKVSADKSTVSSAESETADSGKIDIAKIEMQATQPFVKATSTPKEEKKAVKHLTRRQARSVTVDSSTTKEVTLPSLKLRATKNQSVSYSPKPADVNVSTGDENENVSEKTNGLVKSTSVVSSRSRKRKAATETLNDESAGEKSSKSRSPSINRSQRNQVFRVMFTMVDPDLYESTLKELNITTTTTDNYNALVTDKIYRTVKFMCAVASGKPIVSIDWLDALKAKRARIDPYEYLLKDSDGEKKFKFSLSKTLGEVVKNGGLFQNYSVLVTPSTKPSPDILKEIIASSGGKFLKTSLVPRKGDNILCISDEKDKRIVKNLKLKYPELTEINVEQFMASIFKYDLNY